MLVGWKLRRPRGREPLRLAAASAADKNSRWWCHDVTGEVCAAAVAGRGVRGLYGVRDF